MHFGFQRQSEGESAGFDFLQSTYLYTGAAVRIQHGGVLSAADGQAFSVDQSKAGGVYASDALHGYDTVLPAFDKSHVGKGSKLAAQRSVFLKAAVLGVDCDRMFADCKIVDF